ncbi:uncharacterized protein LOC126716823 [Quercus robur]|uniref:uncharacterized protein LOC126716823 n=1 Tax=Quercus robur TaxID=38942 RepID=UPI002161F8D3|nr:uncharacterized protein LOC126716823 [Quercus robur]XP_050273772.1 uncharacterized protein LOC126716823 [Quercus robur]
MGEFSIQISSDLLNRLSDDTEKLKKKTKKSKKAKVPREPRQPSAKVDQKQISDESETFKGAATTGWPLQTPLFVPVNTPAQSAYTELDAIRSVLQDGERVLDRLQKQEENMVQEVTQRAKDLREKEFKLPYQKPMPCLAENNAWLECYKEHAKDILKCSPLVKSFEDCIRRARQNVSSEMK